MNRRGSALLTVLIVVILVSVITFATSTFISTSLVRYTTQNRNMQGEYLAQAGIHRAIYNINVGSPTWPLAVNVGNNTIGVDLVSSCGTIYQLKSKGTSVSTVYPLQISRTVFAEYDSGANKITKYLQGDGTGILPPVCCDSAWWPFSEGGSATQTGTAPFVGTLSSSSGPIPAWTTDRFNAAGKALNFNAGAGNNNYVLVPDSTGLDLTGTGTIMAWVYINTTVANAGVVQKGSSNAYALRLNRQNGTWAYVELWLANTRRLQSPTNSVRQGQWNHVAVTWAPGSMAIYVNAVLLASNATTQAASTNNQSLYIGSATTSATAFKGKIDEVYIYTCQKTLAEIKAYYNSTCNGPATCPQP